MIDMKNVTKVYTMGSEQVYALNQATFYVGQGEYVAITGPSGSGKSTLMNIIGCLDIADEGEYILDGQPIEDYTDDKLADIRSNKIGFIFQQFNLLSKSSALDNVQLPLLYQGMSKKKGRKRAVETLCRMGLADRVHHKPTELSGGQQQRVAIARALVTDPSLILADEPTGNLDYNTGLEILGVLEELHKAGNTIILITHDKEIAQRAERSIFIRDGMVMKEESRHD
jgi:putative ABC transport system ATP-binding protein